ncbi:NHS-like protein 3 isoform X2 [Nerophis lumbriciformis]|uniref:NHS-like protein 3 isoform X2 n=1 Tax=Nerophis lumbriciformis TaxID=546530 RepID=UPI003BAA3629
MSRRKSTGQLVPRDMLEMMGRQVRVQRAEQHKAGSALGQAFSWLRSSQKKKKMKKKMKKKKKESDVRETDDEDAAKACAKVHDEQKRVSVHYSASQHFQENVFIEGSRPQFLEDLHSEAQEGLKIQQKEEHESGVNFAEDERIASSDTAHPEQDVNCKNEGGTLEWQSNSGITDTVSTRSALTRQGSTFKPLYPVKRLDQNKKKNRRTTIMGIPNQVQKELALHRGSTFQQVVSTNNNNNQSDVFIIPTFDGGTPVVTKQGARVHLSDLEQVTGDKQQTRKHPQEAYKEEEEPLNHQEFGSHCYRSSVLRPKSVVVPGMTTFASFNPSKSSFFLEPQGPVMSISPQATYLSTIIPNAVLPASIEVIEIDLFGVKSTGSAHTASKTSLASSDSTVSPLLSRRSDGLHIENSSNSTTEVCNAQEVDLKVRESIVNSKEDQEFASLHTSVSLVSRNREAHKDPKPENDAKIKRNSTRSLSITKTKQPPAPPRRSNSLHCNKIRTNTKIQVDEIYVPASQGLASTTADITSTEQLKSETNKIPNPVSKTSPNPTEISDGEATKSLSEIHPQKTPSEGDKFERTMSPSSGYSSQSGTPTLSPKEITHSSPDKHKKNPAKPERSVSRASSSASPSSSLTSLSSGTSEAISSGISCLAPISAKEPTPTSKMEELLNVPPPPKVKAPCPPPPETWAQNSRTIELLCGPSPKVSKILEESRPIKESTGKDEHSQLKREDLHVSKSSERNSKTEKLSAINSEDAHEDQECLITKQHTFVVQTRVETPTKVQRLESCCPTMKDSDSCEIATKTKLSPVMKNPQTVLQTEDVVLTESSLETSVGENEVGTNEVLVTFMEPQGVHDAIVSTSAPPDHQPTPPLLRKSPPISEPLVDLDKVQKEILNIESSWPPPPPPLQGDYIFDGADELDFPLPPPPDVRDDVSAVMEKCSTGIDGMDTPIPPLEEFVKLIQDSSEGSTSKPPDPVLRPVVVVDNKDSDTILSCPTSSSISPPSVKASSSRFTKRHSLEVEIHSTTEHSLTARLPSPVPTTSPMENLTAGVVFRRPPSSAHRENRSKELLARHKSAPIPKEDANIPLVTPSLLQMVRLRSVSTTEDSEAAITEDESIKEGASVQNICRQQSPPQKPIRKSITSPPQVVKTSVTPSTPSMRLQEAIRIKTAALTSREGLPCRLGMRTSYHCANESGILPLKTCEAYDKQQFQTSTASFIFSRSTKRALEDQSPIFDQTHRVKSDRVPPPVARKPSHGGVSFSQEPSFAIGDPQQHSKGIALPETTTRVTADTIETLF